MFIKTSISVIICLIVLMICVSCGEKEKWLKQGNEYLEQKKYEQALLYFDKVLDIDNKNKEALLGKAHVFYSQDKYKELLEICNKISEIDPKAKEPQELIDKYYQNKFYIALSSIKTSSQLCFLICDKYSTTWRLAIDNDDDFNDKLAECYKENEEKGLVKKLQEEKYNIENSMKSLQNPTDTYKEAYSVIVDLYGNYIKLEALAENPTGSYSSYTQEIRDLETKIPELISKINILIPQ